MQKNKVRNILMVMVALLSLTAFTGTLASEALAVEESKFRKRFQKYHKEHKFKHQVKNVKKNKKKIVAEVEAIFIEFEAATEEREKLYLIDLAINMANMHMEWNKGPKELLERAEAHRQPILNDIKARKKAAKARRKAEKTPGNFVLDANGKEAMEKAGVAAVIYPHWVHRSFMRCKVCHEDIFQMKRGANELNHKNFDEGKFCGTCHNGELSFDTKPKENCERCHSFGSVESKKLMNLKYYDQKKFEEIAERLGTEWNHDKLPNGKLPRTKKFKAINWVELDNLEAFKPLVALEKGMTVDSKETNGVRDTDILFNVDSSFMKDIIFSHKIHTARLKCAMCHDKIFKKELGSSKVTMLQIKEGSACGTCHGRVSFSNKNCKRCHAQPKGEVPKGVLIRPASN
ncbi:MAG: hypothetical protein KAT46_05030 [Deltaproteobacteria bacterium]|nr:hypothetical protein [Deltaproteobacteria bacterium]